MFRTLTYLLALALLVGCAASQQSFDQMVDKLLDHSVTEVRVPEASTDTTALFLDAREWNEYAVSHITDAVWVGYDDFSEERVAGIPKDREVIVYCSVGYRSEKVSEKLVAMGFTKVSNLYGGMFDWVNEKKPVIDANGKPTQAIHPYDDNWGQWIKNGEKQYKPKN